MPLVPDYPFQHMCSNYLGLHGKSYAVVLDQFSNLYNIYIGKGGVTALVDSMTKLFQDFGVPETITSDGGPQFISDKFQAFLKVYGVYHRLTSVAFPHANTRAELAVKLAKRTIMGNVWSDRNLDTLAVTKALLT